MPELIGVIAAAGRGLRLSPYTNNISKALLDIDGVPILERSIELLRAELGIKNILILVGYQKAKVIARFGNGENLGVNIKYIDVPDINKGPAEGLLAAKDYINNTFCLILGDEVYHHSNHREMLKLMEQDFSLICAVKEEPLQRLIKRNYSVEIHNGLITSLIEKPRVLKNDLLGCGTFFLRPDFFEYIKQTPKSPRTKRIELVEVINSIAQTKGKVHPFMLQGEYININTVDDYNAANYLFRSADFSKKTVSLIIPAYNEEDSIGYVIDDFKGKVNEIIVVNNNSRDKTEQISKDKGARVLSGSFKGYGDALKAGMDHSTADIFILTEADGSFRSQDIGKIMEYLKDADMVLGTRTTSQMIEQSANMSFLLRMGNIIVAKLIELLWLRKHEPRLTDVGCTYRGIWRSAYYDIKDSLRGRGPEFSPEMIIEAMLHNKRIIEIPLTYSGRIDGVSKFSGTLLASARTAISMLKLIITRKALDIFDKLNLRKLIGPVKFGTRP